MFRKFTDDVFPMLLRFFRLIVALVAIILPLPALASFSFPSIDGGTIALDEFHGHPVLIVNTASLCGFAAQFRDMQELADTYGPRGLVVLAVPSNDFQQELETGAAVKKYCAATFDITLPMTEITHVIGPEAHPFYKWLKDTEGFEPSWNFNKVLLDGEGRVVATWGSMTTPESSAIRGAFEPLLPQS